MALQDDLNRLQKQLGNFLFPRKCPFCGTVTGGRLLCGSCERTLPYTGENALRQGTFGRCVSPLYYTGPVREAILRFKFQGRTGGLDCFGRLMADCAARWYPGEFDTVTWVPVSRKRLRQRGFDQSRLLAASLCVDWHVAPVETLRKAVDNPAQSGLTDAEHRRANVLGVYEALPENVRDKRLLLIDDIVTTGSTLTECVRVLREAGAADVVCLTLARTEEEH
ncbi:MAG: ComF family protein [Oscillospiraceae bacterium]|nr:ComF family protein [Oscillospiraceae bacterium]